MKKEPVCKNSSADVYALVYNFLIRNSRMDKEDIPRYLQEQEGVFELDYRKIAQLIHNEWKNRVISTHKQKNRAMPKTEDGNLDEIEVYKLYGTTLVGVLITPLFSFALQIGDGDITFVDDSGARPFLNSDKILGTETHSLSKVDAWKKAITVVYRNELFHNESSLLMLSTDGFSNSFKNEDEFKKACVDYYLMIQQHGAEEIKDNLQNWLDETSELGCGDDITLLLAYSQV